MKKRRIAIASVLKPVDDTRMFEKMGRSLADAGYDVFLLGFPASTPVQASGIHFLPLAIFRRLSFARMVAPIRIAAKLRKVKPELLIVNTYELLIVALANRILFGTRIIYDIQENYQQNIIWTEAFPRLLRPLIAVLVRVKERMLSPFFHAFFLAEKCFLEELPFAKGNVVILENKAILPPAFQRNPPQGKLSLLFSGTLDKSTGVFQAISLAVKLHALDPSVELYIIGRCTLPKMLAKIRNEIAGKSFIRLEGGEQLQPHDRIIATTSVAHFGIVSYPPSPQNANRIPTKLFEYLSAGLPILLQSNPRWESLTNPLHAAHVLDFEDPDLEDILMEMKTGRFYSGNSNEFLWETEVKKMLDTVDGVITNKK